ncbi:MAG TPA: tripartite tricarboxylate transporter TctB family protein [Devosia sp.]|uniref:tripartite tricarboxylate transporter TctB family protein n=1 Tax=Devosia sp. TaxID=1871048 RepID=UPI002DDD0DD5|nr:tripartite tricarboxylate transporter TctB family protein [Devosia sp.]HEV2516543.1 tripartite tricarboxylate transporter TctB family protein [Devosia sp.]
MAQPNKQRHPDWAALVIAAGLLALALLVAWDASRLGAGGAYARIGPQTIPYAIAICLGGLAIWTVIAAYRHDFLEREQQDFPPVLWIVGGLIAQMALIKFAGFSIATGILFAMTARGLGKVSLPLALLSGFLLSAFVWFLFARLLQLTLPAGPIEHLIIQGADLVTAPFKAAPGSAT